MVIKLLVGAIIGLIGGTSSGLFGIGGGVIMVPAFVFIFGEDIKKVIATSLLIIVPTALMGSAKYLKGGVIDWRVAGDWRVLAAVALFAVIGGFIGPDVARKIYSVDKGALAVPSLRGLPACYTRILRV